MTTIDIEIKNKTVNTFIDIILELYNHRIGGASFIYQYQKDGYWAEREIAKITNFAMFFLTFIQLLAIFCVFCFHYHHVLPFISIIIPSALVFSVYFFLSYYFKKCYLKTEDINQFLINKFENQCPDSINQCYEFIKNEDYYRSLRRFLFFYPFSFRYIWWFVLITGIMSAELDCFTKVYASGNQFKMTYFIDFSMNFVKISILAVISYIATNIIRELLQLRDQYSNTSSELKVIVDSIPAASIQMKDLVTKITQTTEKIQNSSEAVSSYHILLATGLQLENFANQHVNLSSLAHEFTKNLADQVNEFIKAAKAGSEVNIKKCFLSTLNGYIEHQKSDFEKKKLITRFVTLGRIAKSIVEEFYSTNPQQEKNIEFFALFAPHTKKFLNSMDDSTDTDWIDYLNCNKWSVDNGIEQNRYFISINEKDTHDQDNDKNKTIESLELKIKQKSYPYRKNVVESLVKDEVIQSLSHWVQIDGTTNLPKIEQDPNSKQRFDIVKTQPKGSNAYLPLWQVINHTYHHKNSCFIREFTPDQFVELLIDENGKLYDYFAVCLKSENGAQPSWIYCIQSRYEPSSAITDVEIFYPEEGSEDQWTHITTKLNLIFDKNKSTIMQNYVTGTSS